MNTSLLNKLCCPLDKHDLEIKVFAQHENGDIVEGLLTCPACRRYYPIIYGIPIMTPDEYREKALEEPILKKWNLAIGENEATRFLLQGQA
ncbi:hypothetical protein GCM10023188_38280 [Pontibacter saemangeumensis]|uniref:Trm112 family protein n=1 Tax=Pontibacter saemangeumensis TaxID=1084525 RepID=A0ABP8M125_9BACT